MACVSKVTNILRKQLPAVINESNVCQFNEAYCKQGGILRQKIRQNVYSPTRRVVDFDRT